MSCHPGLLHRGTERFLSHARCLERFCPGATGSIAEAFDKAVSQLKSESEVETDPVKCAIINASSEAGSHSTLASALNSLWNSVHIVREDGSAILLAENREGVGGGAGKRPAGEGAEPQGGDVEGAAR